MTKKRAGKKSQLQKWLQEPAVIAAIIGVIGTVIAGIITGGFGLVETLVGIREPIKATQRQEATLTALAALQSSSTPSPAPTEKLSPSPTSTPTQTSTPTATPKLTPSPTPSPTLTYTPKPTPTPTEPGPLELYPIAITEVMGNPCGENEKIDAIYNEYIELFNYGDRPVNVESLWISDGSDKKGNPDRIVPWTARETEFSLGTHLIMDDATIPPQGYAVILSPRYIAGKGLYRLPYLFPRDTVILTVDKGSYIGDDNGGIEVQLERNPILLYIGDEEIIEEVISTYGTPKLGGSPKNILDDGEDNIPFHLPDCYSAERMDPQLPDQASAWIEVKDGTPGRGPLR
jgi:hypothetical protein